MKSRTKRHSAKTGNAIAEYALIGAGILVVSLGALALLGTNVNGLMKQFQDKAQSQAQSADSASAQHLAAKNSFKEAQSAHNLTGAMEEAAMDSASKGAPVQTAGGNGDKNYAQIMDSAKAALASGSINQDEYDLIVQVANKGHEIATMQGLLEGAVKKTGTDVNAYANSKLTFNGQTYTPDQLNTLIQNGVADFSALKTKASAQTGVLNNQSLLITLNDSGTAIINNGYATQQQNETAASFVQYQSAGPTAGGSSDTNQNSASICTAGQHLDANNHCVN